MDTAGAQSQQHQGERDAPVWTITRFLNLLLLLLLLRNQALSVRALSQVKKKAFARAIDDFNKLLLLQPDVRAS